MSKPSYDCLIYTVSKIEVVFSTIDVICQNTKMLYDELKNNLIHIKK